MDVTIRIEKMDELIMAVNNLAAVYTGKAKQENQTLQQAPVQQPQIQQGLQTAPVQQQMQQQPYAQPAQQQAYAQPAQQQPSYNSADIAQRNQLPVSAMTGSGIPTTAVVQEYTQDQVAVAMSGLMDAGKRDVVTQILASFGVQALLQIPKEHYPELVLKLREAGANI